MLGYIPSPSSNGISLGPLRLHMYGFLIVAGVFAAVWLSDRRWRARGGQAGTFSAIALWAVPGGLIGARIYHVVTDYELYTHRPLDALKIWQGGLGIWGGIAGGVLAGWLYIRRHDLDFAAILDCAAPALPLAQAIGRWGNYFNQELFGRPTTLPWGLRIDVVNRPLAYSHNATFHPTFLYESLWDLAVVGLVLLIEKRVRLRKGYLFGVYVALYTFGRFFTEYLRIDFAHKLLGLRINDWTSVIVFVTATTIVLRKGLIRKKPSDVEPGAQADRPEAQRAIVAVGARNPVIGGDTLTEDGIIPLSEPSSPPTESEAPESEAPGSAFAPGTGDPGTCDPGPQPPEAPGPTAAAPEGSPTAPTAPPPEGSPTAPTAPPPEGSPTAPTAPPPAAAPPTPRPAPATSASASSAATAESNASSPAGDPRPIAATRSDPPARAEPTEANPVTPPVTERREDEPRSAATPADAADPHAAGGTAEPPRTS